MLRLGEFREGGREVLCRTEAGLQPRRIVRWVISEPGSPWCPAQLAFVRLKSGEQIEWDRAGWPVVRRKRARWQRKTARGLELSDLAYTVLTEIGSAAEPRRCRELVEDVDLWASATGTPPVFLEDVENAVRFLRKIGYVERAPHCGSPSAFRLTPRGQRAAERDRRARRQDEPALRVASRGAAAISASAG